MDQPLPLAEALDELTSAEDFFDYLDVPYDAAVVQVNRLHILQRFHDYLAKQLPAEPPPAHEGTLRELYRLWLARAHQDFVSSDAASEKVFAVFQRAPAPGGGSSSFVPLDKVFQT